MCANLPHEDGLSALKYHAHLSLEIVKCTFYFPQICSIYKSGSIEQELDVVLSCNNLYNMLPITFILHYNASWWLTQCFHWSLPQKCPQNVKMISDFITYCNSLPVKFPQAIWTVFSFVGNTKLKIHYEYIETYSTAFTLSRYKIIHLYLWR